MGVGRLCDFLFAKNRMEKRSAARDEVSIKRDRSNDKSRLQHNGWASLLS